MDPKPNDSAVAWDIAAAFLREQVRSVRPIGQGSNNKNILVETANARAVVKLSHEHRRHRALVGTARRPSKRWLRSDRAMVGRTKSTNG